MLAKHPVRCPKCEGRFECDSDAGASVSCPNCGATLRAPRGGWPDDALLGRRLGDFEVLEFLGRGGMGAVYKARQVSLDRLVALKVLAEPLSRNAAFVERFRREARAAAAVRHPNIIEVHAVGEDQGHQFIAMEFIEGETLAARLKREGRLGPAQAVDILRQTAAALRKAHEAGILHRDIKPSNILLDSDGLVKVADFGLAKRPDQDVSLTQTGHSLGTPRYMSPEAFRNTGADARSDLYSLGATFYHALAGRPPFEGESSAELIAKHIEEAPPPLQELAPDTPAPLCRLIHRLLRKGPEDRYQSAAEVLDALAKAEARLAPRTPCVPGEPRSAAPGTPRTPRRRSGATQRREPAGRVPDAARNRRKRLALLLGAAGAAAALLLLLVLALAGRGRAARRASPPPTPPSPEPASHREAEARNLFDTARQAASAGAWLSADTYLGKLDRTCADTKFFTGNRAAIDALRARIKAAQPKPAPASQDVIELRAADAVIRSSSSDGPWLSYDSGKDCLRGWGHVEDHASWQLELHQPATYAVAAVYAASKTENGNEYAVSVGSRQLKGVVSATDGWDDFREQGLGTAIFTGPVTVTVRVNAARIRPDIVLMDLRAVVLRRLRSDGTPIVPATARAPVREAEPPKPEPPKPSPPEPQRPTPAPQPDPAAIKSAAAAYAGRSEEVWALLKQRKYDDASRLIGQFAALPGLQLARERIDADARACALILDFWQEVQRGIPALKGKTLVLGRLGGTIQDVEQGCVVIRTPDGQSARRSLMELSTQQAVQFSGLKAKADATSKLLLGVFLLAEGADPREAEEALVRASRSAAAPYIERVDVALGTGGASKWPFDATEARRRQRVAARALGVPVEDEIALGQGAKLIMVLIPPGEFMMGRPDKPTAEELIQRYGGRPQDYARQSPQRRVRITRPFWLGKYELTFSQWHLRYTESWGDRPKQSLSWDECQAFVAKLNERAVKKGFRLPTEAEWEYACRAGTDTPFYFGDDIKELDDHAWHLGNRDESVGLYSRDQTHPVGEKSPNAWGLHDMLGNVDEWCQDVYAPYQSGSQADPVVTAGGATRVLRGGAWCSRGFACMSGWRGYNAPNRAWFYSYGLRVARPAP